MSLRSGRFAANLIALRQRGVQNLASASYHKNVIDHYENPRNVGSLDKNDPNVGTGIVGAPACGDVMKLQIKVDILFKSQDECSLLCLYYYQLAELEDHSIIESDLHPISQWI